MAPSAHAQLADASGDIVGYIQTELNKHKELLSIVDGLKTRIDTLHTDLNEAGEKILTKTGTPLSHKIIIGAVGVLAIAAVIGILFNVIRILALGLVIGYLYKRLYKGFDPSKLIRD